jgi:AraC-like DNA-binding protein
MDIYDLMEQTLTYTYYHGVRNSHFPAHHTPEGTWRTLPCLAMVCPHEYEYHFMVQATGIDHRACKDEMVLVPGHLPHRLSQPHAGKHSAVHIQYAMLGALDPLSLFAVPHHLARDRKAVRQALFDVITCHLGPAGSFHGVLGRKEAAFRLLRLLLEKAAPKKEKIRLLGRFPRIQGVLEYIDRDPAAAAGRDALAEMAHLSPARFNYLFREIVGMPPQKYVQLKRHKQALELLREPDLSIEQVADKTGYCDQFHFSRRFKKMLGISPSAYRATIARGGNMFNPGTEPAV